jgi:hypothetical protein
MISLHRVRRKIEAGDLESAKRDLVEILRADRENILAWAFLALVLDDPIKQADCYRQILKIDPANREAAARLQRLMRHTPSRPGTHESPRAQTRETLRCPQCGGPMEVRFIGDLHDKWAVCPYCGTRVDLPDSYERVEREHTEEKHLWGSRRVDREVVHRRRDAFGEQPWRPDIDSDEGSDSLGRSGDYRQERVVHVEKHLEGGISGFLSGALDAVVSRRMGELTPGYIISLAGGALPPEERRACPECGATISKHADRCDWCGTWLSDESE